MNAHRSLQRLDVLKYPSSKIASMVASEFFRAAGRAQYPQIVQGCFSRARELMGLLETLPLDEQTVASLKPVYDEFSRKSLEAQQSPSAIQTFAAQMAEVFEQTSMRMSVQVNDHA